MLARSGFVLIFAALLAALPAFGQGTAYPDRPAKIIVGASPGGSTDFLARTIASDLTEVLGKPFVVENRPGASGNLAAEFVARSPADGYTLLMGFTSMAINPSLFPKLPYDPIKDFSPISLIGKQTSILVVNPKVPANSVKELIALAQQKPGSLNFGVVIGSSLHITSDSFKLNAGLDAANIPYKGVAPAQGDLLAGHVQLMFTAGQWVMQQIAAGTVKPLAVAGPLRMPTLPDVPTLVESGYPNNTAQGWYGLFAPANTPPAIVQKINAAVRKTLNKKSFRDRMAIESVDVADISPEAFDAFLRQEIARWSSMVKAAGTKIE